MKNKSIQFLRATRLSPTAAFQRSPFPLFLETKKNSSHTYVSVWRTIFVRINRERRRNHENFRGQLNATRYHYRSRPLLTLTNRDALISAGDASQFSYRCSCIRERMRFQSLTGAVLYFLFERSPPSRRFSNGKLDSRSLKLKANKKKRICRGL